MKQTYWNNSGKYEAALRALEARVPISGSVPNARVHRALEKFRKAANCYHDLYNNNLGNRAREFSKVFGIRSSHYIRGWDGKFHENLYEKVEIAMDDFIVAAVWEQGLPLLLDECGF